MRRLSADEAALWRAVAGSVRPINPLQSSNHNDIQHKPLPFRGGVGVGPVRHNNAGHISHALTAPPPAPPLKGRGLKVANTLDASWDKRLNTGRVEPDFTIDLHGETLSSAHARLNRSLDFAIRQQARVILLITGRPQPDNPRLPPTSRGVIRASVGDWLAASPHAGQIAAIRGAHPRHGGAGAMYLIMKRVRG